MKPFLILQLRPETEAADEEYEAILRKGGLHRNHTQRIRLDQQPIPSTLDPLDYAGIVVGGGPGCVSDSAAEKSELDQRIESSVLGLMPAITEHDLPFLGCCYGIGILAHHLGATVDKTRYSEPVGAVDCRLTSAGRCDPLLDGITPAFRAFVGHKEAVQELPAGCMHLVNSEPCPYQMLRYKNNVYATQFHPEADGDSFALRVRIYRDKGYFPAHEAEALTARCMAEAVTMPERVLQNFVTRYQRS